MNVKWKVFFVVLFLGTAANAYFLRPADLTLFPAGKPLVEKQAAGSSKTKAKVPPVKTTKKVTTPAVGADYPLKASGSVTLRLGHGTDSAPGATLAAGTPIKTLETFRAPSETAVLKQQVAVDQQGRSQVLAAGTTVRVPVYATDQCTIAFDVGDTEVLWQVDTALLSMNETVWMRITTPTGETGWVEKNDVVKR